MNNINRDWLDDLLVEYARQIEDENLEPGEGCLTEKQIRSVIEENVDKETIKRIKEHLEKCQYCQSNVAMILHEIDMEREVEDYYEEFARKQIYSQVMNKYISSMFEVFKSIPTWMLNLAGLSRLASSGGQVYSAALPGTVAGVGGTEVYDISKKKGPYEVKCKFSGTKESIDFKFKILEEGRPLQDAEITLTNGRNFTQIGKTDQEGAVYFKDLKGVHPDTYTLKVKGKEVISIKVFEDTGKYREEEVKVSEIFDKVNEFIEQGKDEEAIQALMEAKKEYPDCMEIYENLAAIYLRIGEDRDAERIISEGMKAGKASGRLYALKSILLGKERKFEEAIQEIDKAIDLQPEELTYYSLKMELYFQQGKDKLLEALEVYEKIIELGSTPMIDAIFFKNLRFFGLTILSKIMVAGLAISIGEEQKVKMLMEELDKAGLKEEVDYIKEVIYKERREE